MSLSSDEPAALPPLEPAGDSGVTNSGAAGVLPCCASSTGEVLCLLGAERWGKAKASDGKNARRIAWLDFGGRREGDEDVEATASREWAEETLGLFGGGVTVSPAAVAASAALMAAKLRGPASPAASPLLRITLARYTMFLAPVPHLDALTLSLAAQFDAAERAEAGGGLPGAEKLDFCWAPLSSLLRAAASGATPVAPAAEAASAAPNGRRPWPGGAWLPGMAVRSWGGKPRRRLHLHPRLAAALRQAGAGGAVAEFSRAVVAMGRPRARETRTEVAREAAGPAPPDSTFYFLSRLRQEQTAEAGRGGLSVGDTQGSGSCAR